VKIKKFVTSIVAGAALLVFAGAASAATPCYQTGNDTTPTQPAEDVNIYGASAQFTFWSTEFKNYLAAAGCTPANVSWAQSEAWSPVNTNANQYIVQANCGGTTVNFRVASKASYDGPAAVDNQNYIYADKACFNVGQGLNTRPMLDINVPGCAFGQLNCAAPVASATTCKPITWGASDVAVVDFKQVSSPSGRNFILNPLTMQNGTTDFCNAATISFAFFVNSTVTSSSTGTTIDNISPIEARMIYSGQMTNWNQLVSTPSMTTLPIVACARHAGSGTQATADFMIARPAAIFVTGIGNLRFNESTSNMVTCVNANNGAIGYLDADRVPLASTRGPLKLNGVMPLDVNLNNATYTFATPMHSYVTPVDAAKNLYKDMCTYVGRPSKITNPYWTASCQMSYLPKTFGTLATWAPSTIKGAGGCVCDQP
jgi:ABC-type phosphate transport system substrate-binding protein